jgi:GT2 family glycosyltransferase
MSRIAVVILNYNGEQHLRQFLPSVISNSKDATIIVADNHSTDGSVIWMKNTYPQIQILEFTENYGYAGGYNQALNLIESEYYVLLNSDVEVTENWLSPMLAYLDANSTYAAVQPKILDFKNKSFFEYAGSAGGFIDSLGYPYCRGRIFETIEEDQGQYDDVMDIFWASGACFMIRSNDFHSIAGFDSDFFAHMEEIDLCWRLNHSGKKLACIPQSTVYHLGGGTLNKTSPMKTYLNFRNNLFMLAKNLPKHQLAFIIPVRFFMDVIAAFKFWKDQSFDHFKAIIRSHVHFWRKKRKFLNKRTAISKLEFSEKSILFSYYIRGKKTYKDLNSTR